MLNKMLNKNYLSEKIKQAKQEVELRYVYRYTPTTKIQLTILRVDGKVVFKRDEEIEEGEWDILCEEIQNKAYEWIQEETTSRGLGDDWYWSSDLKDIMFENGLYVYNVVEYWNNNQAGQGEKGIAINRENIKKAFNEALK